MQQVEPQSHWPGPLSVEESWWIKSIRIVIGIKEINLVSLFILKLFNFIAVPCLICRKFIVWDKNLFEYSILAQTIVTNYVLKTSIEFHDMPSLNFVHIFLWFWESIQPLFPSFLHIDSIVFGTKVSFCICLFRFFSQEMGRHIKGKKGIDKIVDRYFSLSL